MKFVIDERLKHRLTGVIVILSIAAIFLPAVMKKSNQRFEENVSFSVRLPEKPIPPDVEVTKEKDVFQTVKVARVEIPAAVETKSIQIAKAQPLSSMKSTVPAAPSLALKKEILVKEKPKVKVAALISPALKAAAAPKKLAKAAVAAAKKEIYAVQLASFTQRDNALSLVARLRSKGYVATLNKSTGKQGYYKVIVGQLSQRHEAVHLQKQLASSMQLNGFVIKTGNS